ncbi:hypothetical protein [Paenibacillus odorifer]|uniref:hypothetical protein n=1 Tax=Paenibacillus odorifer TaxID=189426 RepID=UPI00096E7AEA|nr:hypothetical protein [Paenibacillus odorifer]OMD67466.1 hypothetical protein BSK50_30280 [Paenibacillus odorifer]
MSTPYIKVQKSFYAKPQNRILFPIELEREFFNVALSEFELELYELDWNEDLEQFDKELTGAEINLLGRLMYIAYLERENDRIIKLTNIIGKDISLNGMGDSKRFTLQTISAQQSKASDLVHMLKTNSFYDEG